MLTHASGLWRIELLANGVLYESGARDKSITFDVRRSLALRRSIAGPSASRSRTEYSWERDFKEAMLQIRQVGFGNLPTTNKPGALGFLMHACIPMGIKWDLFGICLGPIWEYGSNLGSKWACWQGHRVHPETGGRHQSTKHL